MMKKLRLLFAAMTALTAMLCSCSDHDDETNDERIPLSINATINSPTEETPTDAAPSTRATEASWQSGDAIGIVMLNAGTTTTYGTTTNYRYLTATGNGTFAPDGEKNTAYLPPQGARVDILAYYPHTTVVTSESLVVPVDVSNQTNLAAIDLMSSAKVGSSEETPAVTLAFAHRLCMFVLKLGKDATTAGIDFSGAHAVLKGVPTSAAFDLLTGVLTPKGDAADLALPLTADATATAIIIPTAASPGRSIVITTADGHVFTAPIPDDLPLTGSTVNTYTMTLSQVESTITATVTPWTTGTSTDAGNVFLQGAVIPGAKSIAGITEPGMLTFIPFSGATVSDKPACSPGLYPVKYTPAAAGKAATATIDTDASGYAPLVWDALPRFQSGTTTPQTYVYAALFAPSAPAHADLKHEPDYLGSLSAACPWGTAPSFSLRHLLAGFTVRLQCSDGTYTAAQLAAARLTVVRRKTVGTDYAVNKTGIEIKTVSATGDAASNTVTLLKTDATAAQSAFFSAILAPQTLAASGEVALKLTLKGADGIDKNYELKAPAGGIELKPGEQYTLTATLSKTTLMPAGIEIVEWTKAQGEGEFENI